MRVLSGLGTLLLTVACLYPGLANGGALATCNVEGGRKVDFDTTEGSKINVDISPDGTKIAFDLLGDIYVVPIEGGHATRITEGRGTDVRPVWSPDGGKIAFISDLDGREQVFIVGSNGKGDVRQITREKDLSGTGRDKDREGLLRSAEWLPNSSEIATRNYIYDIDTRTRRKVSGDGVLASTKTGIFGNGDAVYYFTPSGKAGEVIGEFGQPNDLWRLDEPGIRAVRTMTRVMVSGANSPAISKNGRWLVYADRLPVDAPTVHGFPQNGIDTHVEVIRVHDRLSGSSRTLLAPWMSPGWRSNGGRLGAAEGNRFAISPDSRYLVISYGGHIHRVEIETGSNEIIPFSAHVQQCLAPIVRNRFRVGDGPLVVNNMRFITMSPDGKQLAFSALRRIYVQDLPGDGPRLLSPQPFGQFDPSYSPDGRWIAYVSWSDTQGGHVWRAPVGGGKPERLTAVAGYYRTPVWSPDGQRVAFAGSHDLADPRPGFWTNVHGGSLHVVSLPELSIRKLPAEVRFGSALSFSGDGRRIRYMSYLPPPASRTLNLASIGVDGDGVRDEGFQGLFPESSDGVVHATMSPNGSDIAIERDLNLYVVSCPLRTGRTELTAGDCAQTQLTRDGGYDPRWRTDGVLEWTLGNTYHQARIAEIVNSGRSSNVAGRDPMGRGRLAIGVGLEVPRHVGAGLVALKGARVVTMRGDEVIEKGVILVRDGRIEKVGRSDQMNIPAGAKVFELQGKTIVPGFIDMHAHFTELPELLVGNHWEALIALALGTTTVRDPSNGGDHGFAYTELLDAGEMTGPRMFGGTGLLNLSSRSIGSLDDAIGIAERYRRLGGTFLKIHSGFDREQRRWIIEAARRSGLNVVAHVPVKNYGMGRLDLSTLWDGVTTSEHAFSDQSDLFGDVVNFVATAKTGIVVAPLRAGYNAWGWSRVKDDARVRRFYRGRESGPSQFDASTDESDALPMMLPEAEATARLTVKIARAGGNVIVGSHGDFDGVDMHWEMWGHAHSGMTNHEVLRASTIAGARALGVEVDLGSLEAGKIADLLILEKNPLDDIRNTMSIEMVMKSGVLYESSTLDQIWPESRSLPEWQMKNDELGAGAGSSRTTH